MAGITAVKYRELTLEINNSSVTLSIRDGKPIVEGDVDGVVRELENGIPIDGTAGISFAIGWCLATFKEHGMLSELEDKDETT